jgi:small subunit ribosomal protein S1
VSNLTSFGAFVDLGGADGLVHVSELSYNRVNHPSEVLHVGQEVDVMVLSVDRDTKKIALSLKRAQPDPWTTVERNYRVGQVVPAMITKLAKFGAFAKVEEGLEGLIHLTELTDLPVQDAAQVVHEGQRVNVKIIHINSQRRRLGLSVRQAGDQGRYQDYATVEENTPFAGQDFGPYSVDVSDSVVSFDADPDSPVSPPQSEATAGEQDSPAAELEPTDTDTRVESVAATPDEAPPASAEVSSSTDEDHEQPEVASASS